MKKESLRFRQIHLDFHTSPFIPSIGKQFQKKQWQETLKRASVNSMTCFAKCHHGWSYHPTAVGKQHPHLGFDLLRAQYEACKEIGVNVPIYLSAGVDNLASEEHPEWREIGPEGSYLGWCTSPLKAGFHKMDFHSPYLDYLCDQIREVVRLFPEGDGIFLDIITQYSSCSRWGMEYMKKNGLDPKSEKDRKVSSEAALQKYYEQTTAAAKSLRAEMAVFHNSGHIQRGRRDRVAFQTHLELESLPTGGWGYDHFPEGASYVANLGKSYLGMTGKFHTTWGEFGGLKHPNALRYECAAMLAFGARCSVGDQLHPEGALDQGTYEVIGSAYREVESKEKWCEGAKPVAQIAVLSSESEHPETVMNNAPDTGVTRILLEEHHFFALIDRQSDFTSYDVLILPDDIRIDSELKTKLDAYLAQGGKLFLTGESGLNKEGSGFAFDIGGEWDGPSEFHPDFIFPKENVRPSFCHTPFVVYTRSQRIRATTGMSLGEVYDPYFNRDYDHFCSHQHTPPKPDPSGYACGLSHQNILYLAHPVFTSYRAYGHVLCREYVGKSLRLLLGDRARVQTNLPSTARVTLTYQEEKKRWIAHLLYANTVGRGGALSMSGGNVDTTGKNVEVIEELIPLREKHISVIFPRPISKVTLEPQGVELISHLNQDRVEVIIPEFECHQMVVFQE
ncbi:MAG: hypothetical protein V4507_08730 [Verrucomicrobiota bacterium]